MVGLVYVSRYMSELRSGTREGIEEWRTDSVFELRGV